MKNKSWGSARILLCSGVVALAACTGQQSYMNYGMVETPTVNYIEALDVYAAPHKDSFLNQLAMNYRSYAIYNARTSGYAEMGELFANKAVAAFAGEVPFPESLDAWPIEDEQVAFELYEAYNGLMDQLKNDASTTNPELAAEAQAKFDCWLSATATGQYATADQCRERFEKTMVALRDCRGGKIINKKVTETVEQTETVIQDELQYYPDTHAMMTKSAHAREGVIVVNNVTIPEHLINPVPVQPMVFNQNIYGGDKTITKTAEDNSVTNSNNTLTATQECEHGDMTCQKNAEEDSAPVVAVVVTEKESEPVQCPECEKCQECPQVEEGEECDSCKKCSECKKGKKHKKKADCSDCRKRSGCDKKARECRKTEECQKCEECPTCPECEQCKECEECPTCPDCPACPAATCPDCPSVTCPELPDVKCPDCPELPDVKCPDCPEIPMIGDELVKRDEFINMMMAMRAELAAINARLDEMGMYASNSNAAPSGEKTMIKVQQIPLEPQQHIMEEILEIRFDFNESTITPEYQELIKKLATATQENKNIKVSVVGHTDTMGTNNYNYALGGRRAEAVQKMLIKYGIPASQIVAVSAGEEGLAVQTPDNTPNAENRRVRVVKEIHPEETEPTTPMEFQIEEVDVDTWQE